MGYSPRGGKELDGTERLSTAQHSTALCSKDGHSLEEMGIPS